MRGWWRATCAPDICFHDKHLRLGVCLRPWAPVGTKLADVSQFVCSVHWMFAGLTSSQKTIWSQTFVGNDKKMKSNEASESSDPFLVFSAFFFVFFKQMY